MYSDFAREEAQRCLAIIQAFLDGKTIEARPRDLWCKDPEWHPITGDGYWNFRNYEYRVTDEEETVE